MVETDFWTTGAQTMPVLALAIVVEARSISQKWVQGERRVFKSIQGAIWAAPLFLYAIAIPKCFDALAGKPVDEGWTSLISFAVSLGVSALLINPALELLVRSNARVVAHLLRFLASPSSTFQILWLRLKGRRQRQRVRKNLERLDKAEILLRSLRYRLEEAGGLQTTQGRQVLEQLNDKLQGIPSVRAEILQFQDEMESSHKEMKQSHSKLREGQLRKLEAIVEGAESAAVDSSEKASKVSEGNASSEGVAT
ncbi:hypothetical protein [Micromonospora sp. L32]|uniref:hypothetical protein n=1 Tax=Micromonospora sp. L32 TaxID=3452214 RepID=UPI003F8991E5